jgi:hypothetical protein
MQPFADSACSVELVPFILLARMRNGPFSNRGIDDEPRPKSAYEEKCPGAHTLTNTVAYLLQCGESNPNIQKERNAALAWEAAKIVQAVVGFGHLVQSSLPCVTSRNCQRREALGAFFSWKA